MTEFCGAPTKNGGKCQKPKNCKIKTHILYHKNQEIYTESENSLTDTECDRESFIKISILTFRICLLLVLSIFCVLVYLNYKVHQLNAELIQSQDKLEGDLYSKLNNNLLQFALNLATFLF